MEKKVLITRYFPGPAIKALREAFDVAWYDSLYPMPVEELKAAIADADAVISAGDRFDEDILACAPKLKLIAEMWPGWGIDRAACQAHGVTVVTSGYTLDWISTTEAEHAMMQMMAAGRGLLRQDAFVRSGQYRHIDECNKLFAGQGLYGRRLGIVGGAARAGDKLASRALAFGMDVRYWDEQEGEGYARLGVPRAEFNDLIETSDYLVLMANSCKGYLFDKPQFDRMNHNAILCNVTTGSLINEEELIRALRDGRLAGAALDKYENEPAQKPGLTALDNVVLTPHSDGALYDVRSTIFQILADACLKALA